MTIQNFVGAMIPVVGSGYANASTAVLSAMLIDAAGEKAGFMLQAPKTGTISKVGWCTGAVTTGDTVDVRIETIASSVPSGTLWATNTNGSQVVANTDDNAAFLTTLTSGAVVTAGDFLAVVIANGSGGGNLNVNCAGTNLAPLIQFPKAILYTTSWSTTNSGQPVVYFEYNDGSIVPCGIWSTVVGSNSPVTHIISTSTTPDELGNYFSLPFKARVIGAFAHIDSDDEAYQLVLYDSDGTTVLGSISADGDVTQGLTSAGGGNTFLYFTSTCDLAANTYYRLVLKPGTTTSIRIHRHTLSAAGLDSWSMGNECYETYRTDAGAWSQDATSRISIYPIFSGFDDGAGGGLKTHPGMGGGMRG